MKHSPDKELLITLAEECITRSNKIRPEIHWIETRYHELQERHHLTKKSDTDKLIFRKMYGTDPVSATNTTKIRFWRTGRHLPTSHEECLAFGRALELSSSDMDIFLLHYLDGCRVIYETASENNTGNYLQKCAMLDNLVQTYLDEIPEHTLTQYSIPTENRKPYFRHLYFVDAFHHIDSDKKFLPEESLKKHVSSANYATELARSLRLIGMVPRKTMIRHLILLGKANLSLDWINQMLVLLEYRPLHEDHTLVTGEHLDWLLIRLIQLYEEYKMNHSPEDSLHWFRESCCILDHYFAEKQKNHLRFLYFKSLYTNT